MRARVLLLAVLVAGCSGGSSPVTGAPREPAPTAASVRAADFDAMWTFVRDKYAYFGEKATDWDAVRAHDRPLAAAAVDDRAFIAVIERSLDELYDPHTHLMVNLATSWRLPAHDVWAEWRGGAAVITDVRAGSAAYAAGVTPGMTIVAIDGRPTADAVAARRPRFLRAADPAAERWALLSALSGQHDRDRVLSVSSDGGAPRELRIGDLAHAAVDEEALTARSLGDGIGYIRIASFGDEATIEAFDGALDAHRDARALVIDVRNNPGGDTAVACPIMGRLMGARAHYASMARREGAGLGARWYEYVDPRGPWTFTGPVVVLVDRWSTSMAEGFAMGLAGMKRATIVGTRMAGLGAAIERTTLSGADIGVQISAEPVYDVHGAPRSELVPDVLVEPATDGSDATLARALELL